MIQRPESGAPPEVERHIFVVYVSLQKPPRYTTEQLEDTIANGLLWVEGVGDVDVHYLAQAIEADGIQVTGEEVV